MKTSLRFAITAIAAWLLYSSLIVALLGQDENPMHLGGGWELAAEHGELVAAHLGNTIAIIFAAIPLVVAFTINGFGPPTYAIIIAAIASAFPYAVGALGACLAVDGLPLCRYSWQVEALKVALLPLAFGASLHWLLNFLRKRKFNRKVACE